jgi:hypothetical protein
MRTFVQVHALEDNRSSIARKHGLKAGRRDVDVLRDPLGACIDDR